MSIFNQRKEILSHIEQNRKSIGFNENIFEILEGNLAKFVLASLQEQLSERSYKSAAERLSPVNIFRKVVDKLSTLYVGDVTRETAVPSDQELVGMYEDKGVNAFFGDLNESYNSYKYSTIEIYEDEQELKTRVIPSHMFLPYSNDKTNPLKVTAIIKSMGEMIDEDGKTVNRYWVYTADEFMSMDSRGNIVMEDMIDDEGNEITNDYGVIPFVFVSKSRYLLVPMPDMDDFKMTVLFPVLLTDLNFAAKYMAHSIFYGVNVDSDNLQLSPDAFWNFKSDDDGNAPQVGTIKPDVSISEVLKLIKEQMGAWLETKNLKAGSIGGLDAGNIASGVAKAIDEADTTMDRKSQIETFKMAEESFWRVLATIHNNAALAKRIKVTKTFSDPEKLKVEVRYADQKPIQNRIELINEAKAELEAGLTSRKRKIKQLNPYMDDKEIDELILEIDEEKGFL